MKHVHQQKPVGGYGKTYLRDASISGAAQALGEPTRLYLEFEDGAAFTVSCDALREWLEKEVGKP